MGHLVASDRRNRFFQISDGARSAHVVAQERATAALATCYPTLFIMVTLIGSHPRKSILRSPNSILGEAFERDCIDAFTA